MELLVILIGLVLLFWVYVTVRLGRRVDALEASLRTLADKLDADRQP